MTEEIEIIDSKVSAIQKIDNVSILVDETIVETIPLLVERIAGDYSRSTEIYEELRELFLRGETDPEFIAQLNQANVNIQASTDSLIKILDKLSRIKSGDARIQIANIQATREGTSSKTLHADLLDALDEMNKS